MILQIRVSSLIDLNLPRENRIVLCVLERTGISHSEMRNQTWTTIHWQ